jgi:hypothetical protein
VNQLCCTSCNVTLTPHDALGAGSFAWPAMHAFWMTCPACSAGGHILIEAQRLIQISITSAPDPDWKEIRSVDVPGLTFREDPAYLHAWLEGQHYEFPERR